MFPSLRVTVTCKRFVESTIESSLACMDHWAAVQLFLITTGSVTLGNVCAVEYKTRTIESEQTCSFRVPDFTVNRTPSDSRCASEIGSRSFHWAEAGCGATRSSAIVKRKIREKAGLLRKETKSSG